MRTAIKKNNKTKPSPEAVFLSPENCREMLDSYFGSHLPETGEVADIESVADYLGITREDFISFASDEKYGAEIKKARNKIAKIKKQLAFNGKLQPTVLSFDLKNNHGYKDKPEESEPEGETVIFKGKSEGWAK